MWPNKSTNPVTVHVLLANQENGNWSGERHGPIGEQLASRKYPNSLRKLTYVVPATSARTHPPITELVSQQRANQKQFPDHVTQVQGRDEITVKLYKSHFPSGAVSGEKEHATGPTSHEKRGETRVCQLEPISSWRGTNFTVLLNWERSISVVTCNAWQLDVCIKR